MKGVLSTVGLLSFVLVAAASGVSAETFTLPQVYSLALEKNEEIQIARENLFQSEQDRKRALSAVLPKVTVAGTYDRSKEVTSGEGFLLQSEEVYGMEATIQQPIYSGGKHRAGLRIARAGIEASKRDLNLSSESLLVRAAQVFYGVLSAQKNLEAQQHNVERLQEHRRLSELRFRVGEVTETILLRAESELAEAQAELAARENDLAIRRQELRILADLPAEFDVAEPPLPETPADTTREALIEEGVQSREDLQRSRIQEEIAEDRVKLARANFLPTLNFEGTYYRRDQDIPSSFFIDENWIVGVRLEIPIFEGGLRRAEFSQARSQLLQGQLATEKLRKEIELDVTQAKLTLDAVQKVLRSREEQLRFAEKNYEMVSKQFTFGLATNIDLLDANQTLIDAQYGMIRVTYNHHLAVLDLQRSLGIFLKKASEDAGRPM